MNHKLSNYSKLSQNDQSRLSVTSNHFTIQKSSSRLSKFNEFRLTQSKLNLESLNKSKRQYVKYKPDPRYESINKALFPDIVKNDNDQNKVEIREVYKNIKQNLCASFVDNEDQNSLKNSKSSFIQTTSLFFKKKPEIEYDKDENDKSKNIKKEIKDESVYKNKNLKFLDVNKLIGKKITDKTRQESASIYNKDSIMEDQQRKISNQKQKLSKLNMRDYVTYQIDKKWNNSIESTVNLFKPKDIDQAKLSRSNRYYKIIEDNDVVLDERENKQKEWVKHSFVDRYAILRDNPSYMRDAVANQFKHHKENIKNKQKEINSTYKNQSRIMQ